MGLFEDEDVAVDRVTQCEVGEGTEKLVTNRVRALG